MFRQIKTLRWNFPRGQQPGETKTKYYANNALLAQRLEANIVFGVVIKALADAKITRIHTIHDACAVREQDAPKARKVIIKAFKSIGLNPNRYEKEILGIAPNPSFYRSYFYIALSRIFLIHPFHYEEVLPPPPRLAAAITLPSL